MNKDRYLKNLSRLIRRLPDDERERILEFYREIIEDKIENGEPEEQAVRELGDAGILAQKILSENPNRKPVNASKVIGITLLSVFGVLVVGGTVAAALLGFHAVSSRTAGAASAAGRDSAVFQEDSVDPEAYVKKKYTVKAAGITSVVLDAENRAIEIVPADTDEIVVDYTDGPNDDVAFSGENGIFRMQDRENGTSRPWGIHWNEDGAVKITVKVPSSFSGDFSVNTTNSYIRISDFRSIGVLKCHTANSAISLDGLSAKKVDCETKNAAIVMKDVTAGESLSAETENAVITLNGIDAPDISLETKNALISGSISGGRDEYTVEAETTNALGSLQNGGGGPKKLRVKTTNAIISISFR